MALLFVQLSVLLAAVGLFYTNGPVSVAAFVNEAGAGPKLSFILEPPPTAVVAKGVPLLLPCVANVTAISPHNDDFYDTDDEDVDDEDEDDDEEDDVDLEYDDKHAEDVHHRPRGRHPVDTSHQNKLSDVHTRKKQTHFSDLKSDTSPLLPSHFDDGMQQFGGADDDDNDDQEEDDDDDDNHNHNHNHNDAKNIFSNLRSKRANFQTPPVDYIWFRNGKNVLSPDSPNAALLILANGTLKIPYSENAPGTYRCMVNESQFGGIISRESVVSLVVFRKDNFTQNVTATINQPLVLNCPFVSQPAADISWFFNQSKIMFDKLRGRAENRYFQLTNGSLLISTIRGVDGGKYKCVAQNSQSKKSTRVFFPIVNVVPSDDSRPRPGLLAPFQSTVLHIRNGGLLQLQCAAYSENVVWTYTPRSSERPIDLQNISIELRYANVSREKHDGLYKCSTASRSHELSYDVTITSPPVFLETSKSLRSAIAAFVSFNCSASGVPAPNITWYRNGEKLENNFNVNYAHPTLRINTLEPDYVGLYQCFAKNEAGEIHMSQYLSIRKTDHRVPKAPKNIKCYPVDHSNLLITFESGVEFQMVNYYLAHQNPFSWVSTTPIFVLNSSVVISEHLTPLKPFTLFIRGLVTKAATNGMSNGKHHLEITKLSEGFRCATQGLQLFSTVFPSGIFIWWPHTEDVLSIDSFRVQFWHNDTASPTQFSDQIIGTTAPLDEYQTWQNIEPNLTKIPVMTRLFYVDAAKTRRRRSLDEQRDRRQTAAEDKPETASANGGSVKSSQKPNETITEVRIPKNVTGVLIPNTNRVVVRVLGSIIDENGKPFEQDLRYVEWKMIESQPSGLSRLRVLELESRSVTMSWTPVDSQKMGNCLRVCYKNMNKDIVIRGGLKADCPYIKPSEPTFTINNLTPFTSLKIFLRDCNSNEPISEVIDVQTRQDVPGAVTQHRIAKEDGIVLYWSPPANTNGPLSYYALEWTKQNKTMSANISIKENSFKFPNISTMDNFNASIRAVGSAGVGIPVYINLSKDIETEYFDDLEPIREDPTLGIIIGVLFSILLLIACMWTIIRDHACAKNRPHSNQTLPPGPPAVASFTTDLQEMQTLIKQPENGQIIPNGKTKRMDNDNDELNSVQERQRILLTSPPRPLNGDRDGFLDTAPAETEFSDAIADGISTALSLAIAEELPDAPTIDKVGDTDQMPNGYSRSLHSAKNTEAKTQYLTNKSSSPFDESQQMLLNTTGDTDLTCITHIDDDENDDVVVDVEGGVNGDADGDCDGVVNGNADGDGDGDSDGDEGDADTEAHLNAYNLCNATARQNDRLGLIVEPLPLQSLIPPMHFADDTTSIDIDLNESSRSTKPLQSSWNYRRPIVPYPNG